MIDEELNAKYGGRIVRLSEYKTHVEKIKVYCDGCNSEYEATPSTLLSKNTMHGCRTCFMNDLREGRTVLALLGDFIEENSGSKLLTKGIVKNDSKVTIKCNCGNSFETTPHKVKRRFQFRCRMCSGDMSNMEYTTKTILDNMGIKYKQEYTNDKLRTPSGGNLRFDFAIMAENKVTNFIELDGIQHFEEVEFFGGEKAFMETKRRDREKTQYCIKKNINLIRIPYTKKKNIEEIIKEHLVK